MTSDELDVLTLGFLDHSLPVAQWTHHAHCRVTAWLMLTRPDIDLAKALPGLIQTYNVSQGGQNTDTSGYHHTITLFYLKAIGDFLMKYNAPGADAVAAIIASPIGDKDYPLRFYSRERLFSVEARRGWIEPDLTMPFP